MSLSAFVIPALLASVAVYGLGKRVDVYASLTHGAEEGLTVLLRIVPALVGLLTAVSMFRASGAMECLSGLFAPALELLGIPPETAPLMLVRPVSGQLCGPGGGGDAGKHGNHVLHHRRLLWLCRNHADAAHRARRPDGGPGRLCGGGPGSPAYLSLIVSIAAWRRSVPPVL